MFWFWLTCAAVGGVGAGLLFGFKGTAALMRPGFEELRRNMAGDRNFMLSVLRRELANWMFRRDPDRYRQVYKSAHEATTAIGTATLDERRRQLSEITQEHPYYTDFDMIATRDYVLYEDALGAHSYDEVARHYTTIIRFQALQAASAADRRDWPTTGATSDEELAYLDEYVRRVKDTRFKARVEAAIREFRAFDHAKGNSASDGVYETPVLAVRRVSHFAETRYGVHFKDTDEFGLYGVFYPDHRDEPFTGFYRSDATFAEETVLDDMPIKGPI